MKVTRDKSRLINSLVIKFTRELKSKNLAKEFVNLTKSKYPRTYKNLGL